MKHTFSESAKRLTLALGSILVAALFIELALRVLGIVPLTFFYRLDAVTGHAHRAATQGWFRHEGGAYIEINGDGLRGPWVAKEKPEGKRRVAVLGDSYAEGFQLPLDQTFGAVLERQLAAGCGADVEVIGFGVSDYGTAQELLTLRERVWPYDPDIIVLAFHTGNDIRNNSRKLDPNPNRPYFTREADALQLDDSFLQWQQRRRLYHAILSKSALLQHLDGLRANLKASRRLGKKAGAEQDVDEQIYQGPSAATWKEAWMITESLLLSMKREVEERGASLLVVTLSNGIQVHPDASARRAFAQRLGVEDLFYSERRLRDFGERHGLLVLNLAQTFQRHAETQRTFLHGFDEAKPGEGHWNANGHALAGKLIAQRLCQDLEPNAP